MRLIHAKNTALVIFSLVKNTTANLCKVEQFSRLVETGKNFTWRYRTCKYTNFYQQKEPKMSYNYSLATS